MQLKITNSFAILSSISILPTLVVSQVSCGFTSPASFRYVAALYADTNFGKFQALMADNRINQCVNMVGGCQDSISSFGIGPGYACRFYRYVRFRLPCHLSLASGVPCFELGVCSLTPNGDVGTSIAKAQYVLFLLWT